MAIPKWHVSGDWFDVCSCNIPCPCEFAQPPTDNYREGVLAYHVREGRYGDVVLDGLNVVVIADFSGNAWTGGSGDGSGLFPRCRPARGVGGYLER